MSDNQKGANTPELETLSVNVGEHVQASEAVGGADKSPFQNPMHDPRVAGIAMATTIEEVIRLAPLAIQKSREEKKPAIITVIGFLEPPKK
jgi:hypothetical protein